MPVQELIPAQRLAQVSVALEPAYNALVSLMLVAHADQYYGVGLSDWVARTSQALSPEEMDQLRLVINGYYFASIPGRSWPSFPAYLDHLAAQPPQTLVDKLLDGYLAMSSKLQAPPEKPYDKAGLLASPQAYLDFLHSRFKAENVDDDLERRAFALLADPLAYKELIVSTLRRMWDQHLAQEWEQVTPMLLESVRAFAQVDFSGLDRLQAARLVTGQAELNEHLCDNLQASPRVIFVPNPHIGPFLWSVHGRDAFRTIFGARLPEGAQVYAPDLSRNELLVRLATLADDTRLRVLRYLAENGEQRSQDIIAALQLSQSAASRHLTQLSATGYLVERRCEGAKCYSLNLERLDETFEALRSFLESPRPPGD